jgi:hypothetical protein
VVVGAVVWAVEEIAGVVVEEDAEMIAIEILIEEWGETLIVVARDTRDLRVGATRENDHTVDLLFVRQIHTFLVGAVGLEGTPEMREDGLPRAHPHHQNENCPNLAHVLLQDAGTGHPLDHELLHVGTDHQVVPDHPIDNIPIEGEVHEGGEEVRTEGIDVEDLRLRQALSTIPLDQTREEERHPSRVVELHPQEDADGTPALSPDQGQCQIPDLSLDQIRDQLLCLAHLVLLGLVVEKGLRQRPH